MGRPKGGFLTGLCTDYLGYHQGSQYWRVAKPLVYHCTRTKRTYTVPVGFVTDFASFKRLTWPALLIAVVISFLSQLFFSLPFLSVLLTIIILYAIAWLIWGERAHRAAVLHDYLYRQGYNTRIINDLIFLDAMKSTGYWFYTRYPMFVAVFLLGWLAYKPVPGCMDFRFCKHKRNTEKCLTCKYHYMNHKQ
ncbi:MAG: DUF1353 domain-containing protein [Bacteroidota bacterium]